MAANSKILGAFLIGAGIGALAMRISIERSTEERIAREVEEAHEYYKKAYDAIQTADETLARVENDLKVVPIQRETIEIPEDADEIDPEIARKILEYNGLDEELLRADEQERNRDVPPTNPRLIPESEYNSLVDPTECFTVDYYIIDDVLTDENENEVEGSERAQILTPALELLLRGGDDGDVPPVIHVLIPEFDHAYAIYTNTDESYAEKMAGRK